MSNTAPERKILARAKPHSGNVRKDMGRTRQEDVRIEQRRQQVADFYVKGSTQSQISRELGVSHRPYRPI